MAASNFVEYRRIPQNRKICGQSNNGANMHGEP